MKLSQITGKTYNDISGIQGDDVPGSISHGEDVVPSMQESEICSEEYSESDGSEDSSDSGISDNAKQARVNSPELIELAMKWGGTIGDTGKIVNNSITMSRKDFLKYSKNMTQKDVLKDPLLYVMFRSEEQAEPTIWGFLDRFPQG